MIGNIPRYLVGKYRELERRREALAVAIQDWNKRHAALSAERAELDRLNQQWAEDRDAFKNERVEGPTERQWREEATAEAEYDTQFLKELGIEPLVGAR